MTTENNSPLAAGTSWYEVGATEADIVEGFMVGGIWIEIGGGVNVAGGRSVGKMAKMNGAARAEGPFHQQLFVYHFLKSSCSIAVLNWVLRYGWKCRRTGSLWIGP